MCSVADVSLQCNPKLKFNFAGGLLSSDSDLLLLQEFVHKMGFLTLMQQLFKTTDSAGFRRHTDNDNLWQMLYQILSGYFTDDCSDELRLDPVLTTLLQKDSLASQPTISRFYNRMDETTLVQFMENFIKEGKRGFDFASASSKSKAVNAHRLALHALAYSIWNYFRRIVLPVSLKKLQIGSFRLQFLKIASRLVRTDRKMVFALCSSCPYQEQFLRILQNIHSLPQIE